MEANKDGGTIMTEKEILKEAVDKLIAKGLEPDVKYLTSMYTANEDGEIFPLYYAVADYINDNESYEDWDELLYYLNSIGEEIIDKSEKENRENEERYEKEWEDENRWLNSYWAETRL